MLTASNSHRHGLILTSLVFQLSQTSKSLRSKALSAAHDPEHPVNQCVTLLQSSCRCRSWGPFLSRHVDLKSLRHSRCSFFKVCSLFYTSLFSCTNSSEDANASHSQRQAEVYNYQQCKVTFAQNTIWVIILYLSISILCYFILLIQYISDVVHFTALHLFKLHSTLINKRWCSVIELTA